MYLDLFWVYLLFKDFIIQNNVQSYLDDEEDAGPPKRNHYAFIMTMWDTRYHFSYQWH